MLIENNSKRINEHESEHVSERSSVSGREKDDGISGKQLRAIQKLTLYQKGWQRLNKLIDRG